MDPFKVPRVYKERGANRTLGQICAVRIALRPAPLAPLPSRLAGYAAFVAARGARVGLLII